MHMSQLYLIKLLKKNPALNDFGFIPRSGTAGSYGSSIFNFLKTTILFSMAAVPFYIPNRAQRIQLLHIHANTAIFHHVMFSPIVAILRGAR